MKVLDRADCRLSRCRAPATGALAPARRGQVVELYTSQGLFFPARRPMRRWRSWRAAAGRSWPLSFGVTYWGPARLERDTFAPEEVQPTASGDYAQGPAPRQRRPRRKLVVNGPGWTWLAKAFRKIDSALKTRHPARPGRRPRG